MQWKLKVFETSCDYDTETFLTTPKAVAREVADDFDYNESMLLLGCNTKNKIIIKKTIAVGGSNCLMCTPADIFIPLLKGNARNFILVHNHPSGDLTPSEEDVKFTKTIQGACEYVGLKILDHLIVNGNEEYYSFKKNGII